MALPDALELSQHRLDEDLTYRELAERMGVSLNLVYRFLNSPRDRLNERSTHKIQKYLQRIRGKNRVSA